MKFFIRIIILIFFINMSSATRSYAAACCASATAFGVGRLLKWERFAVGIRGTYDSNLVQRNELWGMSAVAQDWAVFTQIPWSWKGFDDVQLGVRYQILNVGIIGNAIFPTGISSQSSWGFSLALALEKSWQSFFTQLNLGTTGFLPTGYNGSDIQFWKGATAQLAGVAGVELPYDLILTLMLQYMFETPRYLDYDEHSPMRHKFPTSIGLTWKIDPNWMLTSSLSSDLSDFKLIVGQLAIRYGYF